MGAFLTAYAAVDSFSDMGLFFKLFLAAYAAAD